MRMAGRFARRVRGWAKANGVAVIDTKAGERKHLIAEQYLASHDVGVGVFLVLVARAPTAVWKVTRSRSGVLVNLEKKTEYVNHYSFHIRDPVGVTSRSRCPVTRPSAPRSCSAVTSTWRAPPERPGSTSSRRAMPHRATEPERLAEIADTVFQPGAAGLLAQVCDRWIYSACVCFGLDFDEQRDSGFGYSYSVYQVEYSRNLLFADGARMQRTFDAIVDLPGDASTCPRCAPVAPRPAPPHRGGGHLDSGRDPDTSLRPHHVPVHFGA